MPTYEKDLFMAEFRIPSDRMPSWDYMDAGYYFVTVCTKDMTHSLGTIVEGTFEPHPLGEIVREQWVALPKKFPYVHLDTFVVMPKHFHSILTSHGSEENRKMIASTPLDKFNVMKTSHLGQTVRWLKGSTTFRAHKELGLAGDVWQARFYEHVIRTEASLNNIREYIELNPLKWAEDEYCEI